MVIQSGLEFTETKLRHLHQFLRLVLNSSKSLKVSMRFVLTGMVYAYYDPLSGGLPITIGYGSTKTMSGGPFFIGDSITQEEKSDLLDASAEKDYWSVLERTIPYWDEMNENQRGALLSLVYNLGAHFYNTRGFDTISRVLREKDWDGVPGCLFISYRNPAPVLKPWTGQDEGLLRVNFGRHQSPSMSPSITQSKICKDCDNLKIGVRVSNKTREIDGNHFSLLFAFSNGT